MSEVDDTQPTAIAITDVPAQSRYEITVDGALAGFARYVRKGGRLIFVHTEIDPAFGGKGLGSKLAAAALADARARSLPVVPLCPFIASYIERHPSELDNVDTAMLAALEAPAS